MRLFNHRVVVTGIIVVTGLCGPISRAADKPLEVQIERLAKPYLESKRVVGLSIGVIRGDDTATVHLGRTRKDGDRPGDDTLYEIGSLSKVFTGILVADAVVQNRVRLDQPAQELLPASVTMPTWKQQPITISHLVTHRSGLPRIDADMPNLKSDDPYSGYTSNRAYEFLTNYKLRRAPGDKYEYSNFGMSFVGHLICRNAGLTYDELLTKRLTGPLNMSSTRVALTVEMRKRLATPHIAVDEPAIAWDFADMPGAGGIRSSTADLLRFTRANLEPPDDDVGRALTLACQEHAKGEPDERSLGLGWQFALDGTTHWHNGQTGGSHSMLLINREAKLAVALLSNTALPELDALAEDIFRMLAGGNVEPRSFEDSIAVSNDVMEKYIGKYQLAPSFVFTVSVEDGKLMAGLTGQPTLQVFARSDTEWFYKVVDASLTFQLDDDGNCQSLVLHQNGVKQTAKRVPQAN